jgi:hypothetical protein
MFVFVAMRMRCGETNSDAFRGIDLRIRNAAQEANRNRKIAK